MLPATLRLSKAESLSVIKTGKRVKTPKLLLIFLRSDLFSSRWMIQVSKRLINKAYQRNRIKRLLRQSIMVQSPGLKTPIYGVLRTRAPFSTEKYHEVQEGVKNLLTKADLI